VIDMWPKTALTQRLALRYPIVQAPMNAITLADMVAAVSSRGGLGSLGSATMAPQQVREQVAAIRARTDQPFALNFFVHSAPSVDRARSNGRHVLRATAPSSA
jgi:nitronate monooxygenase